MYDHIMCISFCMHHYNIITLYAMLCNDAMYGKFSSSFSTVLFGSVTQSTYILHSPVTCYTFQLHFTQSSYITQPSYITQSSYTVQLHSSVAQRKFIMCTLIKISLWWGMTIEKIIVKMMSKKVGGLGWQFSFHTHKHSLSSFPMLQSSFIRHN